MRDVKSSPSDSSSVPSSALIAEARQLLDAIGPDVDWAPDHDWRDDGADQVIEGDLTVCFLATGMDVDLHQARTRFIAAAPRLLRRLLVSVEQMARQLEDARKDCDYHAECRPNRRQAEAAIADAKALNDWRADVTVALQRPGGAFFDDVPRHIRQLVADLAAAESSLAALRQGLELIRSRANGCQLQPHDGTGPTPEYEACVEIAERAKALLEP